MGQKLKIAVTNLLASLVFQNNQSNLDWLERKYREMTINFKDLPAYHWMTDDAREEGLAQGREEGREEGREKGREEGLIKGREEGLEALRLASVHIIEQGFPELSKLAQKQLALIRHTAPLANLVTKMYRAKTSDEVKRYLFDALEESLKLD